MLNRGSGFVYEFLLVFLCVLLIVVSITERKYGEAIDPGGAGGKVVPNDKS
jgi:hypothetical protein